MGETLVLGQTDRTILNQQNIFRLLDWVDREEKVSKLDRIVIIKNMFHPKDFEVNAHPLYFQKDQYSVW